jgi:hypothetical protein
VLQVSTSAYYAGASKLKIAAKTKEKEDIKAAVCRIFNDRKKT